MVAPTAAMIGNLLHLSVFLLLLVVPIATATTKLLRHGGQHDRSSSGNQYQYEYENGENHNTDDINSHKKNPPFDDIPNLQDVVEMANLSVAVYQYRKYDPDAMNVCDDWNNKTRIALSNFPPASILGLQQQQHYYYYPGDVVCHWYRHDTALGTQVMIVSSHIGDYLAVVFAGTDDLKTSLLDVDIRKTDFGTDVSKDSNNNATQIPVSLKGCPECKVHEGFNNAVFSNHIFDDIYVRVESLRSNFKRLFTTGHSLGAANSVLTSLALALQVKEKNIPLSHPITSLNFGCPQVGNEAFRDHINTHFLTHPNSTHRDPYLSIWRFVLGWDLVPRLPEFFEHIGHTVQMHHFECREIISTYCYNGAVVSSSSSSHELGYSNMQKKHSWFHPFHSNTSKPDDKNSTKKIGMAYYHHIGNTTLQYSGVPSGWSAKPYMWVPGALLSHSMSRYDEFLVEWFSNSSSTWIKSFVSLVNPNPPSNHSDALIDDDTYAEPPDDDAMSLS